MSRLALVRRLFLLTHSEKLSIFDRVLWILGEKMEKCFKSPFFLMFTFIFISRESFYHVFKFARTDKITPRVLLGKHINRNSRKPTDLKGWFWGSVLLSDLFLGLQRFACAVRSLHHHKCLRANASIAIRTNQPISKGGFGAPCCFRIYFWVCRGLHVP